MRKFDTIYNNARKYEYNSLTELYNNFIDEFNSDELNFLDKTTDFLIKSYRYTAQQKDLNFKTDDQKQFLKRVYDILIKLEPQSKINYLYLYE